MQQIFFLIPQVHLTFMTYSSSCSTLHLIIVELHETDLEIRFFLEIYNSWESERASLKDILHIDQVLGSTLN